MDNKGLSLVTEMENAHEELINGIIDWKERNFIVTCSSIYIFAFQLLKKYFQCQGK